MAFSVTEFKSNLKQGGARPSLFKVDLLYPSGVTDPPTRSEFLVRASSLPASNIGTHEVFFHGKSIKIAGDRTFDTWETTIINDEDFGIRNTIEEWMNLVSNVKLNTRDSSFGVSEGDNVNYKKDLTVTQFSKQGDAIKIYKFMNAFPTALSPITLDWGAGEIEEFSCTWTYDHWESASASSGDTGGSSTFTAASANPR